MAMRRPRIKATANLMNCKRKPKNNVCKTTANLEVSKSNANPETQTLQDDKINANVFGNDKNGPEKEPLAHDFAQAQTVTCNEKTERVQSEKIINGNDNLVATDPEDPVNGSCSEDYFDDPPEVSKIQDHSSGPQVECSMNELSKTGDTNEQSSFKCPPNVGYNRSNSHSVGNSNNNVNNNDDVFHSDLEDVNVIQMDLIKSSNTITGPMSPMSPSKTNARQRIRPTPIFGQRRNSFVGMSPSPHTGDESSGDFTAPSPHRRERHFSASLSQASNSSLTHASHHHTPYKYVPSMGRIRTESGCSAFSDTYAGSTKSRKADDHQQHHRTLSRRELAARFNNGIVTDKSMLKMFDLIYYNPTTNPMEQKPNMANMKNEGLNAVEPKSPAPSEEDIKTNSDSAVPISVPQLKLNSNGELILDDMSLEIETTADQEARKVLATSGLIYLDENTGMNGFYKRHKRTKEWPPEETIKFYRCLQTIGTDFSLMGQLFPNRTRRDLKLKFKKEERCNLTLINKALLQPKIFNIEELQQQLEVEERNRAEADRKWKEIKLKESRKLKKVKPINNPNASAAARALADGDVVYQNENVTRDIISRTSKVRKKPLNSQPTSIDDVLQVSEDQPVEPPAKKKSKRGQKKKLEIRSVCVKAVHNDGDDEDNNHEAAKMEENNTHHQQESSKTTTIGMDHNQLEEELTDLLLQTNQTLEEITDNDSNGFCLQSSTTPTTASIHEDNKNFIDGKSLVNLDDGTVTFVNYESFMSETESDREKPVEVEVEQQPPEQSNSTAVQQSEMDESDIQEILTELAEGSMVLVSTLDPNNMDKVRNEIYTLDKNTGILTEKPLDIPDAIVQCILAVMG